MGDRDIAGDVLGALLDASHLVEPDMLPDMVREHAVAGGLHDSVIYLVDLQQVSLTPLPDGNARAAVRLDGGDADPDDKEGIADHAGLGRLSVDGTVAGRAFWTGRIHGADPPAGSPPGFRRLYVPMIDGIERVGVLAVTVRARVGAGADPGVEEDRDAYVEVTDAVRASVDGPTLRLARRLASLVAVLLVAKRPFSDTAAAVRRSRPMSLAAEVQWGLLPPLTFGTDRVVIAGAMEPAYAVAGDAFDYGMRGPVASIAIFDAMGHDLGAGLAVSLAVGVWRYARRRGLHLAETVAEIDQTIAGQFGRRRFVTAILATLDTATGEMHYVNRGHPAPVVLRGGRVRELARPPEPPMGMLLEAPGRVHREQLEPGDRVLLYTDGVVEARNAESEFFGLDRFTDFLIRQHASGLSLPETLRRLVLAVVGHQETRLQDDASLMLVEWRGPADRP